MSPPAKLRGQGPGTGAWAGGQGAEPPALQGGPLRWNLHAQPPHTETLGTLCLAGATRRKS